jgi:hypothetical protein
MTQLLANNAKSTVASMVSPSDVTVQVASGEGALFPSPSGGDYFRVTLTQAGTESSWEILTCTSRSGDVLTVERAQEGTVAATWSVGSKVELRLTAGVLWPLESSVSGIVQSGNLSEDLAQLQGMSTFGFAARTENDGWQTRELLGTPNQITVTDGIGADFDPEIGIAAEYPGQESITTLGTVTSGVWEAQPIDVLRGGLGLNSSGAAGTLLVSDGVGWGYLGPDADGWVLTIVSGLPAWAAAAAGTVTSVGLTQPSAGITVSNSPVTSSGNITLALADDLAALEALSSVGFAVRTGTDTWAQRALLGTADRVTVLDGNGVAGAPQVDISSNYAGQTSITTVGTVANGTWRGDPVDAQWGGTNQSGYIPGDMLYALSTVVLDRIAIGPNGKVLTVVANLPSWQDPQVGALASTLVAYGSSGNVVTGNASLTYNDATRTLQLGVGTGPSRLRTADAVSGAGASSLTISTGNASSGVVGAGLLTVAGGAGAGSSAAGSVVVTGGDHPSSGAAGSVAVCGGNSSSGANGSVTLEVGGVTRVSVINGNVAVTGNLSVSAALAVTGNVTVSAALSGNSGTFTSTLQSTSLRVTGSTAPADGFYLQATGVVGLSANNTAAYKYGSNAFLSQSDNSRDLGEASTGRWRNLYIVNSPTVGSDLRGKIDVRDCDLGLEFVLALRPIAYRLAEGGVEVSDDGFNTETSVPGKRVHRGFGAQEVKAVLDRFGLDGKTFAGWCLADPSDPDSRQALRYEQFIAPLVRAVQELEARVKALGG